MENEKKVSKKYVAAFVPNYLNPGTIIHKLYHRVYGEVCIHPERGDKRLMSNLGLNEIFRAANLKLLEIGYMDVPPWPDTIVTIKQFFGVKEWEVLRIPVDVRPLLPFERVAAPKRILAHHCFALGVK